MTVTKMLTAQIQRRATFVPVGLATVEMGGTAQVCKVVTTCIMIVINFHSDVYSTLVYYNIPLHN